MTCAWRVARRERFERLHRDALLPSPLASSVRGLLRANERAGEDLVDLDVEPRQSLRPIP